MMLCCPIQNSQSSSFGCIQRLSNLETTMFFLLVSQCLLRCEGTTHPCWQPWMCRFRIRHHLLALLPPLFTHVLLQVASLQQALQSARDEAACRTPAGASTEQVSSCT
jgi:hypothetical protein